MAFRQIGSSSPEFNGRQMGEKTDSTTPPLSGTSPGSHLQQRLDNRRKFVEGLESSMYLDDSNNREHSRVGMLANGATFPGLKPGTNGIPRASMGYELPWEDTRIREGSLSQTPLFFTNQPDQEIEPDSTSTIRTSGARPSKIDHRFNEHFSTASGILPGGIGINTSTRRQPNSAWHISPDSRSQESSTVERNKTPTTRNLPLTAHSYNFSSTNNTDYLSSRNTVTAATLSSIGSQEGTVHTSLALDHNSDNNPGTEMGYAVATSSSPLTTLGHGRNKAPMEDEELTPTERPQEESKTGSPGPRQESLEEEAEGNSRTDSPVTPRTESTAPSTADDTSFDFAGQEFFQLPRPQAELPSNNNIISSGRAPWAGGIHARDALAAWGAGSKNSQEFIEIVPKGSNGKNMNHSTNHRRTQSLEQGQVIPLSTGVSSPVKRPGSADVTDQQNTHHLSNYTPAFPHLRNETSYSHQVNRSAHGHRRTNSGEGSSPLSSPSLSPRTGPITGEYMPGSMENRGARTASFRSEHVAGSNEGPHLNGQSHRPLMDRYSYQHHSLSQQHQRNMNYAVHQLPPHNKGYNHHGHMPAPRVSSPFRNRQRQATRPHMVSNFQGNTGSSSRTTAEVLKTLLRKKACLYEPETSRAVSLVTWLVGRELAMKYGFFSRQQLQSGVHEVVGSKIEAGIITRTKVNRCMQIILNSCFHYIIPRPDGSEENGEVFREAFAAQAKDDAHLLARLPSPWDDLELDPASLIEEVVFKAHHHSSPDASPTLRSVERRGSGSGSGLPGEKEEKRAVLLCFNENVRSAEDVNRCHNEFIRDTAIASKLHLSPQDWKAFFGNPRALTSNAQRNAHGGRGFVDTVGHMDEEALNKFRTSWCSKRYEHNANLCVFSHVDVSGGWLRRDPSVYNYTDKMCPHIVAGRDASSASTNSCPHGVHCDHAHSREEIEYHPNRYKKSVCPHQERGTACPRGDICPFLHTRRPHEGPGGKQGRQSTYLPNLGGMTKNGYNGAHGATPQGAPMLYVSPAPLSEFEKHLCTPGLRNLFRRQCAVLTSRAGAHKSMYHPFGDDWGVSRKQELVTCDKKVIRRVDRV